MKLKNGVNPDKLTTQALLGIMICQSVYDSYSVNMVVTSISDGKHMDDSKHYDGDAFDLRIWNIPNPEVPGVVADLQSALGDSYDVVLEKDHIHVEYDPK